MTEGNPGGAGKSNKTNSSKDIGAARWTCPTCSGAGVEEFRPFCSARCANRDLGQWLNGAYVLPGDERPGTPETDEDGAY